MAVQRWVGATRLLTLTLRCLPTSVPDGHLASMLKFNVDESRLTSWEINVTHQPECSCCSGWRNLIFSFGEVDGGLTVNVFVWDRIMVMTVVYGIHKGVTGYSIGIRKGLSVFHSTFLESYFIIVYCYCYIVSHYRNIFSTLIKTDLKIVLVSPD